MLEYRRQLLVSKIVLVHNREPKNLQRRLRNSLNNKRKYWRSLKIFHKGGKVGTKAWSLDGALEHVLSVVVWLILFVAAQIKSVPTRETGDGRGAGGSNPAQNPKKGIFALWSQWYQVSGLIEHRPRSNNYQRGLILSCISKLEPTQKPVLGAKNMPLKVVGETGVTIQLGGLRTKDKVLVRCGLLQQVLRWLNTVLRVVSGNSRDRLCF